jgi:ElaB/YqjD/DUF883 family membrane-anchored ribosome-binding protein
VGERADVMGEYRQPGDPDWQVDAGESASADSPEVLRVDIEQTRVEMSGTIDAIQEKLNPDRLKEQVTDAVQEQVETVKENIREATVGRAEQMVSNVGDTAQRAGSGFMETVKQNPIPAALAALGIGWLWMKRSGGSPDYQNEYRGGYTGGRTYYGGQPAYRGGRMYGGATAYGYGRGQGAYGRGQEYYGSGEQGDDQSLGDRVGDVTGQARDKVGDVTGQAKDRVADVAGQAKEQVGQFADQAQDQFGEWSGQVQYGAQRAMTRFDQMLHENPLGVSAAAVALGLAVGMSLPDTPVEDRLMGEARDNVMEKAQSAAQDTMQKVGQVAQQVQQSATETAKDAAQKQGLTSGGSGQQSNQQQASQQSNQQKQQGGTAPATPNQQTRQSAGATTPGQQNQQNTAATMPKPQTSQQGTHSPSQPTTHE